MRVGVRHDDGAAFLARVEHQLTLYDPEITAVQLNLLGSHDMPRILTICGGDRDAVLIATLIQATLPGAPCIYYGDEIGMAGTHDPDCRGAFPVDEAAWDHETRAFVQAVVRLRHEHPVLRRGGFARAGAAGMAAAYARHDADGAFLVALNAGDEPARLPVSLAGLGARAAEPVTPSGWPWPAGAPIPVIDGGAEIDLPARSARVLRLR